MVEKKVKKILATVGLSTSIMLSGCGMDNNDINETEAYETETYEIESEEVEETSETNVIDLESDMEIYDLNDLYVMNVPKGDGSVYSIFVNIVGEMGINYYYDVLNSEKICSVYSYVSCENEWWIPDCNVMSVTKAIEHPLVHDKYANSQKIYKYDLLYLSSIINNTHEVPCSEEKKYQINKLVLLNSEGYYSIYSLEHALSYSTFNSCPVFYVFDINDNKNALYIELNEPYNGELKISFGENVEKYYVTSLDRYYALSLNDKENEIIIGDYWYRGKYNGNNVLVNEFSKYLTQEQEEKGYLTQGEIESLIDSLNEEHSLEIKLDK